jgi:putative hydrolase of the HAD superfamily
MTAIVFDLGAVVLRWRPTVLVSQALPHRAPTPDAAEPLVEAIFQDFAGDWGEFDRGTVDVPELVHRLSMRTGLAPAEVQRVVDAIPAELVPQPGTIALIERLRAVGRRLLFLSNMPIPYAAYLDATYPFRQWFDGGIYSSHVKAIKPEPAIFALLQARYALDPQLTLFIDDSPRNVAAAREHGWQAHRFDGPEPLEAVLREGGWLDAA